MVGSIFIGQNRYEKIVMFLRSGFIEVAENPGILLILNLKFDKSCKVAYKIIGLFKTFRFIFLLLQGKI
jgi:hypothetical protein